MDKSSLFRLSGLPDPFGVVLLSFSFILLLAPYFSGTDFGLFKIPTFETKAKRYLKIIGPGVFLVCLLSFIPLFKVKKVTTEVAFTPPLNVPSNENVVTPLDSSSPSPSPRIKTKSNLNIPTDATPKPSLNPDADQLMGTLIDLVRLEGIQASIFSELRVHCNNRDTKVSEDLQNRASSALKHVRDIQASLGRYSDDSFILKEFTTFRQLGLDLEARTEILEPIVSNKFGNNWNPDDFCQNAIKYKALYFRLASLETSYRTYLLEKQKRNERK